MADATARGLRVLLSIENAPPGPSRASGRPSAAPGAWQPDPAALGAFAQAAARRYAGRRARLADLERAEPLLLPRAAVAQRAACSRPSATARCSTAAYAALKAVDPANLVVTGGHRALRRPAAGRAADHAGALLARGAVPERSAPAAAQLPGAARASTCSPTTRTACAARRSHALNDDDVAVPDLGKLTRIVRAAVRAPHRAARAAPSRCG